MLDILLSTVRACLLCAKPAGETGGTEMLTTACSFLYVYVLGLLKPSELLFLGGLKSHLDSDRGVAIYVEVTCGNKGCGERVSRKDLQTHLKDKC